MMTISSCVTGAEPLKRGSVYSSRFELSERAREYFNDRFEMPRLNANKNNDLGEGSHAAGSKS